MCPWLQCCCSHLSNTLIVFYAATFGWLCFTAKGEERTGEVGSTHWYDTIFFPNNCKSCRFLIKEKIQTQTTFCLCFCTSPIRSGNPTLTCRDWACPADSRSWSCSTMISSSISWAAHTVYQMRDRDTGHLMNWCLIRIYRWDTSEGEMSETVCMHRHGNVLVLGNVFWQRHIKGKLGLWRWATCRLVK